MGEITVWTHDWTALVGASGLEKEQRGSRPSAGRDRDHRQTGVNGPKQARMYRYLVRKTTFNWRAACDRSLLATSPPEKILLRT